MEQNAEEIAKNYAKTKVNSTKTLPKLLIWLKKIESVSQYEDYKKEVVLVPLFDSFISVLLRAVIIWVCLCCFLLVSPPKLMLFVLAIGISILWLILVELKRDLWRK